MQNRAEEQPDPSIALKLEIFEASLKTCGLDDDVKNVWAVINPLRTDPELYPSLEGTRRIFGGHKFEHYADYVIRSRGQGQLSDIILEKSDPVKIRQFDAFVDQFNAHLDLLESVGFDPTQLNAWKEKAISIREKAMELFKAVTVAGLDQIAPEDQIDTDITQ
jgi:hypothetical protein